METIITPELIHSIHRLRKAESHKGDYGRALLVAGSQGMMGAALLSARACMRSGVGLLTVRVPRCGYDILQLGIPEAKCDCDKDPQHHTHIIVPQDTEVIGIGPGLGQATETQEALHQLLQQWGKPMVLDADALNILALHPDWIDLIPQGSILTPHVGEWKRLTSALNTLPTREGRGGSLVVVLKGHHTHIYTPSGEVFVNTQHGNAGMAVGGSGDVLTGIILALLAQHYTATEAATLGVWIHALAADIALDEGQSMESLLPSDIIANLGKAFTQTRKL